MVADLKSSGARSGNSNRDNPHKQEIVAAAIARHVAGRLHENPDLLAVASGDVDVGKMAGDDEFPFAEVNAIDVL